MPILRLNATSTGLCLHNSPASATQHLRRAANGSGPVIIMIHGFKYDPGNPKHSPHSTIFSLASHQDRKEEVLWPRRLGFGVGRADEGLGIAFGWRARGNIWCAQKAALDAGQHLARLIAELRRCAPGRPIHIISHSMGSEVALEALGSVASGSVQRLIMLAGASYVQRAQAALASPGGRAAEVFNVTSRENDLFDFMFERLIAPATPGDRALGIGLRAPNAVNVQLDCDTTLARLPAFGGYIAPATRRICHWSAYMRPGALNFFARVMRRPQDTALEDLQYALPADTAPRWSRLTKFGQPNDPLPYMQKAAS